MNKFILWLNNSKLLLGLLIILMNIGSRYVVQDMPKIVDRVLMSPISKMLVVFSIVYVSTRDVEISLFLTLVFILLTQHLLHEKSPYCIVGRFIDTNNDHEISLKELNDAQKVLDSYRKALTTRSS